MVADDFGGLFVLLLQVGGIGFADLFQQPAQIAFPEVDRSWVLHQR